MDFPSALQVVTHEEEGEIPANGGSIRLVPAWRFLKLKTARSEVKARGFLGQSSEF